MASQPSAAPPHLTLMNSRCTNAARRRVMDLAAAVMLGSIVLYLLQQIEDLTS